MSFKHLYIPNPQKWVKYYENTGSGKHNPYVQHMSGRGLSHQTGGSISTNSRRFMVPIDQHVSEVTPNNMSDKVTLQMVSPTQQTIDQAKSEIHRHKKGIKRKTTTSRDSSTKRRRTVKRSPKPHKKSPKKRPVKKTKKTKSKSVKRKSNKKRNSLKDIFV